MPTDTSAAPRAPHTGLAVTLIGLWAYVAVLYYSYKFVVAPAFAYQGLGYREPDPIGLTAAVLAVSLVALSMPWRIRRPSHFILWVLFIMGAAPAMLIPQYSSVVTAGQANWLSINVAGAFLLIRILASASPKGIAPRLQSSMRPHFWLAITAFSVAVYALMVAYNGLDLRLLSLTDVYDVRTEFGTRTAALPILGYLLPIQQNVINPMLMAKGLLARRFFPLAMGVGGQLLIFTSAGQKTVLFSIGATMAVVWMYRRSPNPLGATILFAVTVGALAAIVVDKFSGTVIASSLFIRRFLIVPGALVAAYVAVFSDRPRTNFADSLLPFMSNPYDGSLDPTHLVGQLFVGNIETAANVSLFGHGFLSFGYIGMYIEGVALGLILWLVDDAANELPLPVASIILLMPAVAISSASVFTAILTHGLLAAVLLLAAMPRDGWSRPRHRAKIAPAARVAQGSALG